MKKIAADAHRSLQQTYGNQAPSNTKYKMWFRRFRNDDHSIEDNGNILSIKVFKTIAWTACFLSLHCSSLSLDRWRKCLRFLKFALNEWRFAWRDHFPNSSLIFDFWIKYLLKALCRLIREGIFVAIWNHREPQELLFLRFGLIATNEHFQSLGQRLMHFLSLWIIQLILHTDHKEKLGNSWIGRLKINSIKSRTKRIQYSYLLSQSLSNANKVWIAGVLIRYGKRFSGSTRSTRFYGVNQGIGWYHQTGWLLYRIGKKGICAHTNVFVTVRFCMRICAWP